MRKKANSVFKIIPLLSWGKGAAYCCPLSFHRKGVWFAMGNLVGSNKVRGTGEAGLPLPEQPNHLPQEAGIFCLLLSFCLIFVFSALICLADQLLQMMWVESQLWSVGSLKASLCMSQASYPHWLGGVVPAFTQGPWHPHIHCAAEWVAKESPPCASWGKSLKRNDYSCHFHSPISHYCLPL